MNEMIRQWIKYVFACRISLSLAKILKQTVSQHHNDHSRSKYIVYFEAEVGVMW